VSSAKQQKKESGFFFVPAAAAKNVDRCMYVFGEKTIAV
jgi:hypothetical protein